MAFPASFRTRSDALSALQGVAVHIKAMATDARNRSAAGPVNTEEVRALLGNLRTARQVFSNAPGSQAFIDFAQASLEADGYTGNIVEHYGAVLNELNATIAWIAGVAGALWQGYAIDPATGIEVIPTFAPATTADLRTRLDALIATID